MLTAYRKWLWGLALAWIQISSVAHARPGDLTHQTMTEVMKVAKAIAVVQPNLSDAKYMEYGMGIYRASKRYGIQPSILIAITQQETGFRENLPEGKAGEIGICQIRKMWLNHPRFKKDFKNPTLKDLHSPAKSFQMAAWILRDIKVTTKSKTLPFWSYYNAVRFENRFRYFLRVNRNIAALRKNGESYYHGVGEPLPKVKPEPQAEAKAEKAADPQPTSQNEHTDWLARSVAALKKKGGSKFRQDQLIRAAAALGVDSSTLTD